MNGKFNIVMTLAAEVLRHYMALADCCFGQLSIAHVPKAKSHLYVALPYKGDT